MFFFSSRRRHTRCSRDWSSDVCSSDLVCHARPPRRQGLLPYRPLRRPGRRLPRLTAGAPGRGVPRDPVAHVREGAGPALRGKSAPERSEEHTSELQSRLHLVCGLLLEKKKNELNAGAVRDKEAIQVGCDDREMFRGYRVLVVEVVHSLPLIAQSFYTSYVAHGRLSAEC